MGPRTVARTLPSTSTATSSSSRREPAPYVLAVLARLTHFKVYCFTDRDTCRWWRYWGGCRRCCERLGPIRCRQGESLLGLRRRQTQELAANLSSASSTAVVPPQPWSARVHPRLTPPHLVVTPHPQLVGRPPSLPPSPTNPLQQAHHCHERQSRQFKLNPRLIDRALTTSPPARPR